MNLPHDFVTRMESLFQPKEFTAFIHTYDENKVSGIRINPLKISNEQFESIFPHSIQEVPFCPTGYYYDNQHQPGKSPFHLAGLYYIQEPSAMFVAEVLNPTKADKVLDLCAAPGGKSTHIASLMENCGLLISNEIHSKRVKSLSENIERLGIKNTVVTNETPQRLADRFSEYFDKILVDAPCSGEGMFRKDPDAISFWSTEHVNSCSMQQKHILDSAYQMLAPGGTIVYSTCTFSVEENEEIIDYLINQYPDMEILEIPKHSGIQSGNPNWVTSQRNQLSRTARLWPHYVKGEGHFVAKLKKTSHKEDNKIKMKLSKSNLTKQQHKDFSEFQNKYLNANFPSDKLYAFNTQLFSLPENCPDLHGLKVIRPGLHLGEFKKNRFEPNHALALSFTKEEVKHHFVLTEENWLKYVKGETIPSSGDRGWIVLTIQGFPLGWGKESKGIIKNFYPKGLRIM